jgi:hypothetical protein
MLGAQVFVYVKNVDCTKNCVTKSVLGVQSEGVGMPECACAEQGVSGAQECAYPRVVLEHNVSEGVGVPKCACAGQEYQEHRVRVSTAGVNGTRARVCIPSKLEHF